MVVNQVCCWKLIEKKKTWIITNFIIYAVLWILTIIMLGLNISTFLQYQARGVYHIEFTSINDTDSSYALIKDNYNISSCSDKTMMNFRPIPDFNSSIIGQNSYSTSLIGLFWAIIAVSLVGNLLIDAVTIVFFLRHDRDDAKEKKEDQNRCDRCSSFMFFLVCKALCSSTYSIPGLYMGLFDSSKACLLLNSPLIYEFLFKLWLPTLIISFTSVTIVIVLMLVLIFLHLKSGDIVWNSRNHRCLGIISIVITMPLVLYTSIFQVVSLIPLIDGSLNVQSKGVIISSLVFTIYHLIRPFITLCR